jgi:hypothetical protein
MSEGMGHTVVYENIRTDEPGLRIDQVDNNWRNKMDRPDSQL